VSHGGREKWRDLAVPFPGRRNRPGSRRTASSGICQVEQTRGQTDWNPLRHRTLHLTFLNLAANDDGEPHSQKYVVIPSFRPLCHESIVLIGRGRGFVVLSMETDRQVVTRFCELSVSSEKSRSTCHIEQRLALEQKAHNDLNLRKGELWDPMQFL
jgi:hypothetical protein